MLKKRLLASYVLLTLVCTFATGLLMHGRLRAAGEAEERADLLVAAAATEADLRSLRTTARRTELQAATARAGALAQRRVTVIAADGVVWSDSERDPANVENHGTRPEVLAARPGAPGSDRRRSATTGRDYLYVAHAAPDGFFVRVAAPLDRVEARLAHLNRVLVDALALEAGFALLLGVFVATRLTRRIDRQLEAARRIVAGDLAARVAVDGDDELDALGLALNRVAERLEAQIAELRARRKEIADVLDSTADGLIAVNSDDVVTHVNPEAARMFEAGDDAVGRPFWETLRDAALPDLLLRVRRELRHVDADLALHRPPPRRDLDVRVTPIKGSDGAYAGAVLAFRDVTRLHKLEAVRRDFVTNVSHEMKTPLTSILGSIETLIGGAQDDPSVAPEFLAKIERNARSLAHLVTDLLELSRIESGGVRFSEAPVAVQDLVAEASASVADKAREKGVRFDAPEEAGGLAVRGDPALLIRALVNLMDNAVAYTPRGGSVAVRVREADGRAEIEVRDTGIGIPAGELERVFERFYRVDKARSRSLGGTGLGLAIVRHVAERHGGSVRVRSEEGRGSTFTLSLPLFDEA